MFSLQTIFGKGDKFYGLLEASATAAHQATAALVRMLDARQAAPALHEFMLARKLEKELTAQISQELVNTFVTALEREDIEALAAALNKITKSISKFAERYALAADRLGDVDFTTRAEMLEKAGAHVAYGVVGMKTHCKAALVVRQEGDGLRTYAHLGTGNYHPRTAQLYTDLGVFTCNPAITDDTITH
jgi:hypothetical protein